MMYKAKAAVGSEIRTKHSKQSKHHSEFLNVKPGGIHKSPGTDQIPAELIKAGGRTIRGAIHKLIIAVWNKEELPEEWKQSVIVPIHKKGDKTECNNYRGISLLPATYKILSNILLSRLIPYAEEIMGGSSMWIPTQ